MREKQTELIAQLTPVRSQCALKIWVVISAAKKTMTRQRDRQVCWDTSTCLKVSISVACFSVEEVTVPIKSQLPLCSNLIHRGLEMQNS